MCHCGPTCLAGLLQFPLCHLLYPPLPPNSHGTKLSKRGWEDGLSQAGVGVGEGRFSAADVPRGQSDEQRAHSEALEGFLVITMVGVSPRSFICSLRAWG